MCGRFTYAKEFRDTGIRFNLEKDIPLFRPRYNISPEQVAPIITTARIFRCLLLNDQERALDIGRVRSPTLPNRSLRKPALLRRASSESPGCRPASTSWKIVGSISDYFHSSTETVFW